MPSTRAAADHAHQAGSGERLARRPEPLLGIVCQVSPDPAQDLHAGTRVVVRYRLHGAAAGASDALGYLLWLREDRLAVLTRTGVVVVERADVLLAKSVPPPPPRLAARCTPAQLQYVMLAGWPPAQTHWLGGWLLRSSGGYTKRANSVLPLGVPPVDTGLAHAIDRAIDTIEEFYAERGLPAVFTAFGPVAGDLARTPLAALLAGRRYVLESPTVAMTAAVGALGSRTDRRTETAVEVHPAMPAWWLDALGPRAAADPVAATAVLTGSPDQVFLAVREGTDVLAIARVAFARSWAGLFTVWVDPGARRRGLAGALLGVAADQASHRSAASMYLQVEAGNAIATGLYTARGFSPHHTYGYLRHLP